MVDLHHQRDVTGLQPLEDDQLPQGAGRIQGAPGEIPQVSRQLSRTARTRQRCRPDMVI